MPVRSMKPPVLRPLPAQLPPPAPAPPAAAPTAPPAPLPPPAASASPGPGRHVPQASVMALKAMAASSALAQASTQPRFLSRWGAKASTGPTARTDIRRRCCSRAAAALCEGARAAAPGASGGRGSPPIAPRPSLSPVEAAPLPPVLPPVLPPPAAVLLPPGTATLGRTPPGAAVIGAAAPAGATLGPGCVPTPPAPTGAM